MMQGVHFANYGISITVVVCRMCVAPISIIIPKVCETVKARFIILEFIISKKILVLWASEDFETEFKQSMF